MSSKVEYLGYVIDKDGLHSTTDKIKAIREACTPTYLTELKAFWVFLFIMLSFCLTCKLN